MINVTEKAVEKIQEALKEKGENPAIRVYIAGSGWGGPSWGLALDEPKDEDFVQKVNGFRVLAEQKLIDSVGGVTVDYTVTAFGEGFKISGNNESPSECGSCSC